MGVREEPTKLLVKIGEAEFGREVVGVESGFNVGEGKGRRFAEIGENCPGV